MKVNLIIISLVTALALILSPVRAMALDAAGVAVAGEYTTYLDDLQDFTDILEEEADYVTHFCSDSPENTWWQEESAGGEDNDYADNTELSLIYAHSWTVNGHQVVGFGSSQNSTGPTPVCLGYDSPDEVGYNIWWFIIECEVFNDTDWGDWGPCLKGSHMFLGFKNKPLFDPSSDFTELARRLTGTGIYEKETAQMAFVDTFCNAEEPTDDNIIRIVYENEDVRAYDYIDSFTEYTTVDQDKWGILWSFNDTTPPSAINNLAVSYPTQNSLKLTWTDTGDDGSTGTASYYDIRKSTSEITYLNFNNAQQVTLPDTFKPQIAGTNREFTVTGLNDLTTYYFAMKIADGVPNWSSISNVPYGQTLIDSTPPAVVTDLAVGTPTTSSIPLTWHAPGDDGSTGTATEYDIRYSLSEITENNYSSASQATGEPTPQVSGTQQNFTLNGLDSGTRYYFAIKTRDERYNWSGISNLPYGETLPDTTPPSAITDLSVDTPTASNLRLTWHAPGDDGNDGTATEYDIRYSTSTITAGTSWDNATQLTGEPAPEIAGTEQHFTVNGLSSGTQYYFAMKTADEVPNWSNMSNCVSGGFCSLQISASPGNGGSISYPGEDTYYYMYGVEEDIQADPEYHWYFVNWTGDTGTIANPNSATTTITMNGNYTIQANFAIDRYTLTLDSTDYGNVTEPSEGSHEYDWNTVVDLEATPTDETCIFLEWTGDVDEVADIYDATTTITMYGNYSITANFAHLPLVTVTLQGGDRPYPAGYNGVKLAIKLYDNETELDYSNILTEECLYEYSTDNGDIEIIDIDQQTKTITFTVNWDCDDDIYNITLWDTHVAPWDHTLINLMNGVDLFSLETLDMETLQEGNSDANVTVDGDDFDLLLNDYGSYPGHANWNTGRSDFDHTQNVDSVDYSVQYLNWNHVSPIEVGGEKAGGEPETFARVDVSLKTQDSATSLSEGKAFFVTVEVNSGTQNVDAIDAYLTFDPACLEVMSVTPGKALGITLAKGFDNTKGLITLCLGRDLEAESASGKFTLGTIEFKPKKEIKETSIRFETSYPRKTNVAYHGQSLLGTADGLEIEVQP